MIKIVILVATMTGTAEMIAEEIQAAYSGEHMIDLHVLEQGNDSLPDDTRAVLIISSTYDGEIPPPAQPFFMSMKAAHPDLSHLCYGVIALGDSAYADTFAFGGRECDRIFSGCGAQRFGKFLVLDVSTSVDMVEEAVGWAGYWCDLVARAVGTP